jgi:hypothetical protein
VDDRGRWPLVEEQLDDGDLAVPLVPIATISRGDHERRIALCVGTVDLGAWSSKNCITRICPAALSSNSICWMGQVKLVSPTLFTGVRVYPALEKIAQRSDVSRCDGRAEIVGRGLLSRGAGRAHINLRLFNIIHTI